MSHPPGVDPYYTSRVHLFSPHSHVVLARLCAFHSYFGISKQTEIVQEVQEAEEHYFCSSVYLRKMKNETKQNTLLFCRVLAFQDFKNILLFSLPNTSCL